MQKFSWVLFFLLFTLLAVGLYHDIKFSHETHIWMPPVSKTEEVQGVVTGLPLILPHRETFTLQTSSGPLRISQFGDPKPLFPGDAVKLKVGVMQRTVIQYPGQFDVSRWLKASGWAGEATVISPPWPEISHPPFAVTSMSALLGEARWGLLQKLMPYLVSLPQRGYILALVLGDRSYLSAQDWWMFQSTGTNHLVAIAGLHIGFLMLMVFLLLTGISRLIGGFFVKKPCLQGVCRWGAFGFGAFYAMLSGFSLPAKRALWMALVGLLAWQMRRQISVWVLYFLALAGVLLLDPWSLEGASFWLSFGAVACLIYSLSGRPSHHSALDHYWRPQWVLFVGLWPLTLIFFHQISFMGFVANLIVVPLTLLIVMPLLLLGLLFLFLPWPSLDIVIWKCADQVLTLQIKFLLMLARWPYATVPMPEISVWKIVLVSVGVMIFLMPKALKFRGLSFLTLLPLVFPYPPVLEGHVKISFLHSSKIHATLIQTHHHALLLDAGGRGSWESLQTFTLIPWLKAEGVSRIDLWIEARPLVSARAPDRMWQRYLDMPVFRVLSGSICQKGEGWEWDQIRLSLEQGVGETCQLVLQHTGVSSSILRIQSFAV